MQSTTAVCADCSPHRLKSTQTAVYADCSLRKLQSRADCSPQSTRTAVHVACLPRGSHNFPGNIMLLLYECANRRHVQGSVTQRSQRSTHASDRKQKPKLRFACKSKQRSLHERQLAASHVHDILPNAMQVKTSCQMNVAYDRGRDSRSASNVCFRSCTHQTYVSAPDHKSMRAACLRDKGKRGYPHILNNLNIIYT